MTKQDFHKLLAHSYLSHYKVFKNSSMTTVYMSSVLWFGQDRSVLTVQQRSLSLNSVFSRMCPENSVFLKRYTVNPLK